MGNNAAFTAFERTVVAVYNTGALTKKLLRDLAEPYQGMDIDGGGMEGTLSKPVVGPDGVARRLDILGIVAQTWTGKPPKPAPKLPKDTSKWTPAQDKENEDYHEARWAVFSKFRSAVGWE
jgi:hypothetical protein